jgi:hypothetical protein
MKRLFHFAIIGSDFQPRERRQSRVILKHADLHYRVDETHNLRLSSPLLLGVN